MNRRNFIKRGALFVPAIFIPKLIRAQSALTAQGLAAFVPPAASGGGGGPSGTAYVTGITPASALNFSIPLGMLINVGGSPINVTALGAYKVTGNTGTRAMQVRDLGCSIIASCTTADFSTVSDGQMVYGSVSVTLSASTEYYIFRVEDGSQNSLDISNYTHTSVAVATHAAFFNGSCTTGGSSDQQYGGVDFKYA